MYKETFEVNLYAQAATKQATLMVLDGNKQMALGTKLLEKLSNHLHLVGYLGPLKNFLAYYNKKKLSFRHVLRAKSLTTNDIKPETRRFKITIEEI